MELVKKGKIPDTVWYGKCSVCKSIFKSSNYELNIISNKQGGTYNTDFEYFYITYCNVCKTSKHCKSVTFYSFDTKSGLKLYREANFNTP